MRFEALKLRNFQGHEDFLITFAPDVTTIIGPSDVGKSAVLRALRWVCMNEGSLDDLLREGAANVRVGLKVEHEERYFKVTRERGAVGNIYTLQDREFKAFGVGVPPPIADALAVNDINFQGQFDAHFWFSLSPPEVSRQLNAVVDLSMIDEALGNMASEVRTATERKSICGERVSELKRSLQEAEVQRDRVEDFKALEVLYAEANNLDKGSHRLEAVLTDLDSNDYAEKQKEATEYLSVLALARTCLDLERQEINLFELLHQAHANQAVKRPPDFAPVGVALRDWEHHEQDVADLRDILQQASSFRVAELESAAKKAEAAFHQQLEGKTCPLCQRPLPQSRS